MELNEILVEAGFPYDEILYRFSGNEGLLKKYLLKFPQDPTFQELKHNVEMGDYVSVETSAHTLKGVSANLGFEKLSEICAQMVMAVREGENEKITPLFHIAQEEYDAVLQCLKQID